MNKGVEVEHNETSFDYQSLRYTANKREIANDNESMYQGTEYILTSVNKGVRVEHLKNPSIKRHRSGSGEKTLCNELSFLRPC